VSVVSRRDPLIAFSAARPVLMPVYGGYAEYSADESAWPRGRRHLERVRGGRPGSGGRSRPRHELIDYIDATPARAGPSRSAEC
jgi:hypothetical protein